MATKEIYLSGSNRTSEEKVPKANPLAPHANHHFYRDPATRGRTAGQKEHTGKKHNGNPYMKGPKHTAWQNAYDINK